jgi:glycosyltransferase involved in cell wall biosynthesis
MTGRSFVGRLGLQQRVLTIYRARFFDLLAQGCEGGLSVGAGLPFPDESITVTDKLNFAQITPLKNHHILRGSFYLCYQGGLLPWLKTLNPDALIVEANPRYLSTPLAVRWMKDHRRPVLGWGLGARPHSGFPLFFQRYRQALRLSFLNNFDALITYSQRGAQEYASLGFPSGKIFIAPNAATERPSRPMPSRQVGIAGRPFILFVGRLQPRKKVDLLLQACASLPPQLQPRLVIVGDGPERSSLEALAKSIYPTTEFPGTKHGRELEHYFSAADLFVLPGTGGLAVQEAMSHGLPVIMGRGDGTNEDLVRPENGWQIPADDLSALTETLRVALTDIAHLRSMGSESYRIVKEEINLEKMVAVFLDALNSVK